MRIRHDAVFVSSVLLTIGLVSLLPMSWGAFLGLYDEKVLLKLDAGWRDSLVAWGRVGEISLVIICIGLIVTWTGYIKCDRSAWIIMFIIVWFWAFPLFVKGFIFDITRTPFPELVSRAFREWGDERVALYAVAHITPMAIALILPIRSFFGKRKTA